MPDHIQLAHDSYLAWSWHLIAERPCILCKCPVQPSECLAIFAGTWQINLLHLSLEERMPLTEMFQKRLILHIACDLTPHYDLTDPADQMDGCLVGSGHCRPKARLLEHFRDGIPEPALLYGEQIARPEC
jgi:hypothetical protein